MIGKRESLPSIAAVLQFLGQVEQTRENKFGKTCADGGICARLDGEFACFCEAAVTTRFLGGEKVLTVWLLQAARSPFIGEIDLPAAQRTPPAPNRSKSSWGALFCLLHYCLVT